MPIPTNSYRTHGAGGTTGAATQGTSAAGPTPYPSNGLLAGKQHSNIPHGPLHTTHPQMPAQQVLMSAADRWGLLGLSAMIKNARTDADQGLSSMGTNLGTTGLDMGDTNIRSWYLNMCSSSTVCTTSPDVIIAEISRGLRKFAAPSCVC
jgi:CCR4-NOT transcription complex subunit 2